MVTRTQMPDPRLVRRRCVACGYDGALLRDGLASRCARCGCDLRLRPARSYLEMEGFARGGGRHGGPLDPLGGTGVSPRWVAFTVLALVALGVIVYMTTAALSV